MIPTKHLDTERNKYLNQPLTDIKSSMKKLTSQLALIGLSTISLSALALNAQAANLVHKTPPLLETTRLHLGG
jgi:hypothetical protein